MTSPTTSGSPSRPDLHAHEYAIRLPIAGVVDELSRRLTPRLVAYLAGMGDTRTVNEWANGDRTPRNHDIERRLRLALQVSLTLSGHDTQDVVRGWFQGVNPLLDERSPARLLRDADLDEVGPAVLAAARAHLIT